MLKFFFNRDSWIMKVMEVVGIICMLALLVTWWPKGKSGLQQFAFYFFIFEYLFIRAFATISWYKSEERFEGIELQFKKALIPTSYILPIFCGLLLLGAGAWLLYIADLLLAVIAHVNVILIYFHMKDKETLPINYFTHGKHLLNN